jgi:hypothetical protein
MKNSITVEVEKTISIQSFEPVKVRVSETMLLTEDNDTEAARKSLYKRVTRSVAEYVENEKAKWEREAKARKKK